MFAFRNVTFFKLLTFGLGRFHNETVVIKAIQYLKHLSGHSSLVLEAQFLSHRTGISRRLPGIN